MLYNFEQSFLVEKMMHRGSQDICSPDIDIASGCNDPDVGQLFKQYYLPVLEKEKKNWKMLRGAELCDECRCAQLALELLRLVRFAVCTSKNNRRIRSIEELSEKERERYRAYCEQACREVRTMDARDPPAWVRALYGEIDDRPVPRVTNWYAYLHEDTDANEKVALALTGPGDADRFRENVECADGKRRNVILMKDFSEVRMVVSACKGLNFRVTIFTQTGGGLLRPWKDPNIARRKKRMVKKVSTARGV